MTSHSALSSPQECYDKLIDAGKLSSDEGQKQALILLDQLFNQLSPTADRPGTKSPKNFVSRLLKGASRTPDASFKGVYLHGGVGRGKTMLMDLFAQSLAKGRMQRFHFHDFMVAAQDTIQQARLAGDSEPIESAADRLIAAGSIICFDEMEVRDIADAMIVKRLFDALWARGMVLIATSNRAPDDLYLNGLHRDRFLPFIDALKEHNHIHHITDGLDWRTNILQSVSSWYVTHSDNVAENKKLDQRLDMIFVRLSAGKDIASQEIIVAGRILSLPKVAGDLADVHFDDLCRTALGARDYLVLADKFAGMMLRDIPVMGDAEQNEARRFMWLVDALYDRGRFLIASAQAPQDKLYDGSKWAFEFQRTCSRLNEMARYRGLGAEIP